jgi:single-stranded-DNA-specific exonuclease
MMGDLPANNGKKPKRWITPKSVPPEVSKELKEFPIVFQQILFNRGIQTTADAAAFLCGTANEHDPFLMTGMTEAVEIIWRTLQEKKFMAVYGDYDVDGVTATALLVQVLQLLGASVIAYIPNRFDEGYGLNNEAIQTLKNQSIDLIITVDCGIRSVQEAELARELGIGLIITDHHHPREVVPPADAVICPRQVGDDYPYKELVGVGIAYKIARALFQRAGKDPSEAEKWLDLVALGTVSDIAPLTGENRLLVKKGLMNIQQGQSRQGIYSLSGAAKISYEHITAGDIGFGLGPRLNAAGRMDSALNALNLLMSDDPMVTGKLAQELDDQNKKRQENTKTNQAFAETQIQEIENQPILIAFGSKNDFHEGIVGLVAARLVESHYRPAVIGVIGEETSKASCRSIDEFHITKALDECTDLLVRHGGHSKAAGFTVLNENREQLIQRLYRIAAEQLNMEDLIPSLHYDADVDLGDLQASLMDFLSQIEPTGNENPKPVLVTRGLRVLRCSKIGSEKTHLRLTVKNEKGLTIDAVAFRQGFWADQMPEKIDLLYTFELNEYNGRVSFQLNVKDIRPTEV